MHKKTVSCEKQEAVEDGRYRTRTSIKNTVFLANSEVGGAQCGAPVESLGSMDEKLLNIIANWGQLPNTVKESIYHIVSTIVREK